MAIKKYGLLGARFPHLNALVGVQSMACFLWAGVLLLVFPPAKGEHVAPITAYWLPGLTNSVGPALGFQALKNISYPAQVLAKSCKMVPVMLMGTLIGGKHYSSLEYLCAGLIAAGISLFAKQSSGKVVRKLADPNAPWGYTLCLLNLLFDGYTNAKQDEVHKRYKATSALWTMAWMNFWCSLFYGIFLFGVSSAGTELAVFCGRHPAAAWDLTLFCLCGAVGQLFIFFTIKVFGSLANTLICTTRKFFNILLSVVWNGNPLLLQQWVAVGLVFAGLLASSVYKSRRHAKPEAKKA